MKSRRNIIITYNLDIILRKPINPILTENKTLYKNRILFINSFLKKDYKSKSLLKLSFITGFCLRFSCGGMFCLA